MPPCGTICSRRTQPTSLWTKAVMSSILLEVASKGCHYHLSRGRLSGGDVLLCRWHLPCIPRPKPTNIRGVQRTGAQGPGRHRGSHISFCSKTPSLSPNRLKQWKVLTHWSILAPPSSKKPGEINSLGYISVKRSIMLFTFERTQGPS